MITGIPAVRGSWRTARSNPKPSSFGIITSVRIRSDGAAMAAAQASAPSPTAVTR